MSRGLNKVQIIGYSGKDPETRVLPSGNSVTNFSVGVSDSWVDKNSGEKKERTEWFNITCFGKLAEIANEYITKGKQVYVEGQQRTEKWEDKEGNTRYSTKLYADQIILLRDSGGRAPNEKEIDEDSRRAGRQSGDPGAQTPPAGGVGTSDFDSDDIPFAFFIAPLAGVLAAVAYATNHTQGLF